MLPISVISDCLGLENQTMVIDSICRRSLRRSVLTLILSLFGFFNLMWASTTYADSGDELVQTLSGELSGKSKADKIQAIQAIVNSDSSQKGVWLQAILDGDLFVEKKSGIVVFAVKNDKQYDLISAVDGSEVGVVKKRALRKISIDNSIRRYLKSQIGLLAIENKDSAVRLAAINMLSDDVDVESLERIRVVRVKEADENVQHAMDLLLFTHDLKNGSAKQKEAALNFADGKLDSELLNALKVVAEDDSVPLLSEKATNMLLDAQSKRQWYSRVEQVFFGVSLGSVLVIAAIGLAITFGVMGVINMAHGELIMLGAYTTWFIQQMFPAAVNYSLIIAVPAAFMVSGLVGILIERTVIRHLYGRPLETLLATFGISLMLQQFVRTVVSPQNVAVINPVWMSGSWAVNPALSLSLNRLVIIGFCLLVFASLVFVFTRTGYGLQMRAVSQNRQMAKAMGIRSARVDALSFGLGSGVAGIAGVALSQLGNVGPNLGQSYIIDSFMVVVFGGVGNLWGTLVAGMSLGIANKFLEPWAGAVLAKVIVLIGLIVFIQNRPRGLFPQRGRAVED